MRKIDETLFLEIRALVYAIDKFLDQATEKNSVNLENALMLSAMLIKKFEEADK